MTRLQDRIASALLWLAAFSFATGVFFSLTLWFGVLPPVKPVAVGVVTIQHYSKLRDYLGAALFKSAPGRDVDIVIEVRDNDFVTRLKLAANCAAQRIG